MSYKRLRGSTGGIAGLGRSADRSRAAARSLSADPEATSELASAQTPRTRSRGPSVRSLPQQRQAVPLVQRRLLRDPLRLASGEILNHFQQHLALFSAQAFRARPHGPLLRARDGDALHGEERQQRLLRQQRYGRQRRPRSCVLEEGEASRRWPSALPLLQPSVEVVDRGHTFRIVGPDARYRFGHPFAHVWPDHVSRAGWRGDGQGIARGRKDFLDRLAVGV
eukprot:450110-Alexandrium_andersonii.AAC.1